MKKKKSINDDDNKKQISKEIDINKLKENLESKPGKETLENKNILSNSNMASSLQANAKLLENQQKKDKLKQSINERSDEKQLYDSGIKQNKGLADSLQPTANILSKQQNKDKLKQEINNRSNETDLYNSGIKKNKGLADSLQQNTTNLEREQKKDKLKKGMRTRSDSNTLAERNILAKQNMADKLQATAKSLETQQKKDKLKQFLEVEEIDEDTLYDKGIKKNRGISDSLQANAESLQKEQMKDTLNKQMKNRSNKNELATKGILKSRKSEKVLTVYDNELQEETQNIISSLNEDQLNKLKKTLENDIKSQNNDYDPQIYVYLNAIIGDELHDHDNDDQEQKITPMSPNTRQTMDEIINEENRRIHKRDSKIEMEAMQKALQSSFSKHDNNASVISKPINRNHNINASTLDKQIKTKKLKDSLENRPNKQQLTKQNILPTANNNIASTIQQNAVKLEKKQKIDKLKQNINERKDEKELYDAGIKKNKGVADALQSTVNALEKQQNKDKLKQELDQRSTAKDLKDQGIIYSQHIAPSLQPNASELEIQLSKLKQFSKQTVEKNKNLQKQTQEQRVMINKLTEIITRKANEIKAMRDINAKQSELISNLNETNDINESKTEQDSDVYMDIEMKQCLQILSSLNNSIKSFQVNYNKIKINEIGSGNIDELINANSIFNKKIDQYIQITNAIHICSNNFKKEIISIQTYIKDKYIPNTENYKQWSLNDILLWIKSLEQGRYIKYLDILSNGFIESEIIAEELPDLCTADLSVTPFNIKIFKDKRDLIKQFTSLRTPDDDDDDISIPQLVGNDTNEVVQSIMEKKEIMSMINDVGIDMNDVKQEMQNDDRVSDLSSVNAQGPTHIPFNNLTEYQEKQLYGKYYLIRRDIINILDDTSFDDGSWGPILVRLAWHASGTFNTLDGSGGSNGATMRFKPEMNDPENNGLQLARQKLEIIKQKYDDQISYADLWIFASYIAIEAMNGPYIEFRGGRTDNKPSKLCPEHGRLPSAKGDSKHVRQVFNRMGFNDQEIVALIGGGHVLGRCHKDRTGYDGPWVDNPIRFSNEFFEELFENDWEEKTIEESGNKQFKDKDDELMMLPTDMLIIKDEEFKKYAQLYYKDQHVFFKDFANAYKKLTELGCDLDENNNKDIGDIIVEKIKEVPKEQDNVEEEYVD